MRGFVSAPSWRATRVELSLVIADAVHRRRMRLKRHLQGAIAAGLRMRPQIAHGVLAARLENYFYGGHSNLAGGVVTWSAPIKRNHTAFLSEVVYANVVHVISGQMG